jgi:hypothetical protein
MNHYSRSKVTNDNAIVIADLIDADEIHVIKFDQNYNNPKLRKEYKMRGSTKIYSLPVGSYRQVVFLTEPGIYFISNADYKFGNTRYYTTQSGLTPEGEVIYGAFELKQGDTIYIGDIQFNWNNSDKPVTIVSRYNAVKSDLLASVNYKELASKVKPAKFYGSGSIINVDANGDAHIVAP